MSDDVVAELDRWLGQWDSGYFAGAPSLETIPIVQRARDEIQALRKALHAEMMGRPDKWHAFIAEAREEALEEAVRVCEGGYTTGSTASTLKAIAVAIRALKAT